MAYGTPLPRGISPPLPPVKTTAKTLESLLEAILVHVVQYTPLALRNMNNHKHTNLTLTTPHYWESCALKLRGRRYTALGRRVVRVKCACIELLSHSSA